MPKTVKDLLLALLNATLILVAICLFLFWKASAASRDVIGAFAGVETMVTPLRSDLQTLSGEVREMRGTLAAALALSEDKQPAALARLAEQVDTLDARMAAAQGRLAALQEMPAQLMTRAVSASVDRAAQRAGLWRSAPPAADAGE